MAVSRRLRFEILRRDNYACRYCGSCAPDVPLTVDHVVPVALGGGDEASNLVTACKDCNAGKSSASPDATLVADVSQDALRWSQAMQMVAVERHNQRENIEFLCDEFETEWDRWTVGGEKPELPPTWPQSIEQFYAAGLTSHYELINFVRVAMSKSKVKRWEKFNYFCGCCWRAIDDMQERARQIIHQASAPTQASEPVPLATVGGRFIAAFTDWDFYEMLGWCDYNCNSYGPDERDRARWYDEFVAGWYEANVS